MFCGLAQGADRPSGETVESTLGKRVMFIYDEPLTIQTFQSWFSFKGYETATANSITNAVQTAIHFTPDVIVCDAGLPDGPIERFLNFVEQNVPDAKVILTTGNARNDLQSRVFDILVMPISLRDLNASVERAFGFQK